MRTPRSTSRARSGEFSPVTIAGEIQPFAYDRLHGHRAQVREHLAAGLQSVFRALRGLQHREGQAHDRPPLRDRRSQARRQAPHPHRPARVGRGDREQGSRAAADQVRDLAAQGRRRRDRPRRPGHRHARRSEVPHRADRLADHQEHPRQGGHRTVSLPGLVVQGRRGRAVRRVRAGRCDARPPPPPSSSRRSPRASRRNRTSSSMSRSAASTELDQPALVERRYDDRARGRDEHVCSRRKRCAMACPCRSQTLEPDDQVAVLSDLVAACPTAHRRSCRSRPRAPKANRARKPRPRRQQAAHRLPAGRSAGRDHDWRRRRRRAVAGARSQPYRAHCSDRVDWTRRASSWHAATRSPPRTARCGSSSRSSNAGDRVSSGPCARIASGHSRRKRIRPSCAVLATS